MFEKIRLQLQKLICINRKNVSNWLIVLKGKLNCGIGFQIFPLNLQQVGNFFQPS